MSFNAVSLPTCKVRLFLVHFSNFGQMPFLTALITHMDKSKNQTQVHLVQVLENCTNEVVDIKLCDCTSTFSYSYYQKLRIVPAK